METINLHKIIDELPANFREMVAVYVQELQQQLAAEKPAETLITREDMAANRRAGLGELRGKIWIADDFDEPLDDFANY